MPKVIDSRINPGDGNITYSSSTDSSSSSTDMATESTSSTVVTITGDNLSTGQGVYAGTSGTKNITMNFRSLLAGGGIDITGDAETITITNTGVTEFDINDLQGNLSVAKGGTGVTAFPVNYLLAGNAAGPIQTIAPSLTSNQVLSWDGTAYVWIDPVQGGGGGSVTSVGLTAASNKVAVTGSPITTSGAFTVDVTEANLSLNNLGGTLSTSKGGTGRTSFTDNTILVGGTAGIQQSVVPSVANTVLTWDGTAYGWTAPGTVKSVGVTAGSNKVTVSGSPVTNTGVITVDVAEANLNLNNQTGTLATTKGGTGLTSLGTSNQYLRVNTAGTGYEFFSLPSSIGTVTSVTLAASSNRVNVTGSTITTSGTLGIDVTEANLNHANIGGTVPTSKGGTGLTVVGTANQQLRVNSGATGLEYFTPAVSGTVTSVGITAGTGITVLNSPVTTSGTITVGVDSTALAINTLSGTLATNKGGTGLSVLGNPGQSVRVNTGGNGLEYYTPTSGNSGTVTSVAMSTTGNKFSITGSPITETGEINIELNEANIALANLGGVLSTAQGGTGLTNVGTSGQFVRVNGDASGLEYATITQNPGTVTSVGVTSADNKLTVTGAPVTSSGTFSLQVNEANLTLNNLAGAVSPTKGGTGLTALGTAGQSIRVNTGATGFEYYTPAVPSTGTVTSVGLTTAGSIVQISASPVTTSGSINIEIDQTAINILNLAGTLSVNKGGTGLTTLGTTGQSLRVNTAGTGYEFYTPGSTGVTSVGVTAGSNKVSVSGSPITSSGTITVDVDEANLTLENLGGIVPTTKGGTGLTTLGIAGQLIRVNAGATGFEFYTPSDGSGGFATVATTGQYSDLFGTPTLATVATSGQYSDLSGLPTLTSGTVTSVGVTAGSSKVSVSGSPITTSGAITVDVTEANLTLSNLGGTLATTKGGTGLTTLGTTGQNLRVNTAGTALEYYTPVVGESNTASNVGSSGVGVFLQKTGVDLQFKKLIAGSNVTLTDNGNTITVDSSGSGGGGANSASQYQFQINANGGGTITSTAQIVNAPAGWTFAVATGVITVTHTVGRPPINVVSYASTTTSGGAYKVRNMDVNSGNGALTIPDSGTSALNTTQVQFTVTTTTTGSIANGIVQIRMTF